MTTSAAASRAPEFEAAFRTLLTDPAESARLCRVVLERGENPGAKLLLAAALRLQGDFKEAERLATSLAQAVPRWAGAHFEQGMAVSRLGRAGEALRIFATVDRLGELPGLWREVGDARWAEGDHAGAEQAYLQHLASRVLEPGVHAGIERHRAGDLVGAEAAYKLQLKHYPHDVLALRLYAEFCSSLDRYEESEALLRACLARVPNFSLGRFGLANVVLHKNEPLNALVEIEALLARDAARYEYLSLKADALGRLGRYDEALVVLESMTTLFPNVGSIWLNYGHILRTLGRRAECEAAYRKATALGGPVGEASWGLANLKTYRFGADELAGMRRQLAALPPGDDRVALGFAIGKALEDEKDHEAAFRSYAAANAERRAMLPYDHTEREAQLRDARTVFTRQFFEKKTGSGVNAADPIFIVGMPRSGSTLVEQILASHSMVEGTQELLELLMIARRLGLEASYPAVLGDLEHNALQALGEEYLSRTRVFRHTSAPRFIDKMPNNFAHVGLIHLILPHARIIDVRRHPLACGFSNFKQHWASGQSFSYDLADIGRFYRNYVELMAHYDAVLPGRVHRVIYEHLVAAPESQTRALLAACDLPFEEGCLRFFENDRAVRTPSSEQVRKPVNSEGLDAWRPFEPWLVPMKSALGQVLDLYPDVPAVQG